MGPPDSNFVEHQNFVDALELIAGRRQAARALQVPGRKPLAYNELGQQIRYVRECLSGWGVTPGHIIAGAVPSRPELAVACVTLPASSTFAPLDPALTLENYSQLLVRMRPAAVLALKGQKHPIRMAARQLGIPEIDLVAEPEGPAGVFTLELHRPGLLRMGKPTTTANFGFIVTSSGTTAQPKLVPLSHRRTLLLADVAGRWLEYSEKDVCCLITPIHQGNGFRSSLLNPLLNGLSVVCLPNADVDAFFSAVEQFQLTVLNAGFTVHRAILRRSNEFREVLKQSRIRFLRAGTGRLEPAEIDALEQAFRAPVLVSYASAEASVISHDPLPPRPRRRGAAGLRQGNEVGIMDEEGRISAANGTGTGEIVVRGPLLFSGYLDDPALTAESFAGDWFRTGDLGRIDQDGYVFITGRIKEVISRGGEKISPAEIDAVLQSLAGVKEAAAFAVPHPSLGEEVVAALVAQGPARIDEVHVLGQVRALMGPAKTPKKIYLVDALPRTSSGKVQRHELPRMLALEPNGKNHGANAGAPVAGAAGGAVAANPGAGGAVATMPGVASAAAADTPRAAAVVAPAVCSPLEGAVAGLWAALLCIKNVGRTDNFFQLGGDEARAAQLLSQVKMLFGVQLPPQSLAREAATVAGMAQAIESIRKGPPQV